MVAFKFDPVDLLFSAGGAAAAMMILHFVHVQVRAESHDDASESPLECRSSSCHAAAFLATRAVTSQALPPRIVQAQAQGFTAMCPPLGAVAVLVFALPAAPASKPISVAAGRIPSSWPPRRAMMR